MRTIVEQLPVSAAMAAIVATLVASPQPANADHHQSEGIKAKIQAFYMQMGQGNFAEAMQFVATPSGGFMPYGLGIEMPNEMARAAMVANGEAEYEAGHRTQMMPKHITVRELGDSHALATYYAEGGVTEDEVEKHALNRVTLVLAKGEGDEWKIIHWHVSALEMAEDREVDDDEDDDDDD